MASIVLDYAGAGIAVILNYYVCSMLLILTPMLT